MSVDTELDYPVPRPIEPDPKLKKDIEARSIFRVRRAWEFMESTDTALFLEAKYPAHPEFSIVLCSEWYFKPGVDYEVGLAALFADAYKHYAKGLANPEEIDAGA